ncbi:MAG: DNA repair protein RadC [Clostridia bacterium]|nr:DNA repair protein RadC [Clostridia bacterium]
MEELHKNHRQRLKNRFLEKGLEGFEDHNVLELLLFYAIPRKDTNEIGHRLIKHFGSISAVFEAPIEELMTIEGMGENSAAFIKLMPAIAKRYLTDEHKAAFLNSSKAAGEFFLPRFIGEREECVYIACLDAKAKVIKCELIHRGSFNSVEINVRKIAQTALFCNAAGVIISHNHPGGVPLPSEADNSVTYMIKNGLEALGIELYDHIIVGDKDYVSYADSYPNWRQKNVRF